MIEIPRNQWPVGHIHHWRHSSGSRDQIRVDIFGRHLSGWLEHKIDSRYIWCRHPDRDTVKLPCQLWKDQADGARGTGRRWHHAQRRGASSVGIPVIAIDQALVPCVGMAG